MVAAVTGLVNARAWYGLAVVAARLQPRAHESLPARILFSLPFAPIAAVMVSPWWSARPACCSPGRSSSRSARRRTLCPRPRTRRAGAGASSGTEPRAVTSPATAVATTAASAVLVVGGWGSSCCDAANGLRAMLPGVPVRQFSYVGLNAKGQPVPSGPSADDLPLPVLGDRIAAQVRALHAATGRPVAVVAESEGTLGVYAMLARTTGLPLSSVVLLSPIVGPGSSATRRGRTAPRPRRPRSTSSTTSSGAYRPTARAVRRTCSARSASSAPGTSTTRSRLATGRPASNCGGSPWFPSPTL